MEEIFKCVDLVKTFSGKSGAVRAVDGISFSVGRGEVFGLVGESGSGKSTLGNLLCSLENPDSGKIFFEGQNISLFNRRKMLEFRKKVQIIFQDPYASLNPKHKIGSIIEEGLIIHKIGENSQERKRLVNEMRTLVALPPDVLEKYPSELSGGQRQRVAIASAMILRPEFVVCDECVSSLDVLIQAQILKLLKGMQKSFKLTYLFISHNLKVTARLADRIGVMYKGKIVEQKSTSELLRNPEHPYTKKLLEAADLCSDFNNSSN
ncbi:MAG: ABC transporter ATP-binding protein [Treponema sp.]|nr:ABC transporter ATP-binding protein [Treponema sp.]